MGEVPRSVHASSFDRLQYGERLGRKSHVRDVG